MLSRDAEGLRDLGKGASVNVEALEDPLQFVGETFRPTEAAEDRHPGVGDHVVHLIEA